VKTKELPTQYQQFIHLSRYSRWDYKNKRRETWSETVNRYFKFFEEKLSIDFQKDYPDLVKAVLNLDVMPSMRCLMTAGPALEKENVAGYNCSYVKIDSPKSFDEILYILMNGTGVGFSVEEKYTNSLPIVPETLHSSDTMITVRDSKLGWAKALKDLLALLYVGVIPEWDVSNVRPAGSILKTFGGRASGPEPLVALFNFVIKTFKNSLGRRLRPIECHDVVCKIAEIVVVGGVRRSALISLSDLGDVSMRQAKSGRWWDEHPHRALANNSANYHSKPDTGTFLSEWVSLYKSKSGERGIFSSSAAKKQVEKLGSRREPLDDFGTNPCSEIILRSREFCNLSEVVIRTNDSEASLKKKIEFATILGTMQSTLTSFKYLGSEWKRNCEEERLLGVSLTGIMDNELTAYPTSSLLTTLKEKAIQTNKKWSLKLGIPASSAITCIKPSGTVSQLVDSSSGIHARHAPYYIRRVRMDIKDPLCNFMIENNFPSEPDVINPSNIVFSFPQKSPEDATHRGELSALGQLHLWSKYSRYFCEHKPSCTISVKENEWVDVGAWVYEYFDSISGISFLPYTDHVYTQAPYEECTVQQYLDLESKIPEIDWKELTLFEQEDYTVSSQELACTGNTCEII
jgi:ribonucleoside-diphosphate reductase alpha chain